ncbi:hypothetical protein KCU81_g2105, partial [Aureobasidium melanogenum]|uniref:Uncharacterized protein n=1 Tax=Aureobasidium melanogenum (strain CBS 110374) TaxID=1043003 RepID=A0A074VSE8_AURM1
MGDTSYQKLLTANETKLGRGLVSSSLELMSLSNTTSYEPDGFSALTPDVGSKWTFKPRRMSTALGPNLATWTQQALRSFRLLLPMAVGPWKKKEQPKIALCTGLVPVLTGLLVHVLPLATCIALIYLNVTSYFIGTHVSTLTFQFLAKFLELLVQASLGSAVFVYLRALFTGPDSVPFGALFAGLQITSISYLWSLEFAGVVTSREFKRVRKLSFLLLIAFSVVLAAGIGPSIAIALTLGGFHNGWAVAWLNVTEDQIFPSTLSPKGSVHNISWTCIEADCLDYGWEAALTIAQSAFVSTVVHNIQQGTLGLTRDFLPYREIRWNTSDGLADSSFISSVFSLSATVTLPSKIVAWSLNHLAEQSYSIKLWPTGNQNFTTTSRQPIVTASCGEAVWLDSTTLHTTFRNNSDQYILQSDSLGNLTGLDHLQFMFLDHDQLVNQGPSKLNPSVWVLSRYYNGDSFIWGICAVYAGYAHAHTTVSSNKETIRDINKVVTSQTDHVSASNIAVPATWLKRTMPDMETLLTAGEGMDGVDMATFFATFTAITMAQWPDWVLHTPDNWFAFSGGDIIIGNPRINNSGYANPSLRWLDPSTGDHVFYPDSEHADTQGKYKLEMDVSTRGYGYHIDQPTKIIAIAVLAAYCLFIATFIVLTLTLNQVHSNAWDSIGELTALAIMSQPDDKLRNTSAGIETVALFKLPMNIRANDNNHLEIVFKDDERAYNSGVVEKNKKYE